MGSLPLSEDSLPPDLDTLTIDEVSRRLRVSSNRVRTLIHEHQLLAVSRGGAPAVPAVFFDDLGIVKHFTGLVEVLFDGGYTRDEIMEWLFTVQDDLEMYPAQALHTHSAREVIRRAQAQAF
ncbi:Rv2175c family DNA-binding protein [Gordonia insulae]|uniref:DNA-binding protein n=1 Tax=Gordonia insulae TaxID=2420509 RepID=A0A3G8JGF4_9ACTN|nr:Rv2175c family DNA-binding protein [Gordonia insulae]AZG43685.1 DNA-binding protein [Gordonia insulae]